MIKSSCYEELVKAIDKVKQSYKTPTRVLMREWFYHKLKDELFQVGASGFDSGIPGEEKFLGLTVQVTPDEQFNDNEAFRLLCNKPFGINSEQTSGSPVSFDNIKYSYGTSGSANKNSKFYPVLGVGDEKKLEKKIMKAAEKFWKEQTFKFKMK